MTNNALSLALSLSTGLCVDNYPQRILGDMMRSAMRMIDIIDKKRQGGAHAEAEITWLVKGIMAGNVPDYQLSAWLMAVCCQGLSLDETAWLTQAYVESGSTLDMSDIPGVVVDKHSTGGVGDKTTLVLIPMLAACGAYVAKLSGRGLGFTGGTADKLEAIRGFRIALTNQEFISQIQRIGVAISSQTKDLAPADAIVYALRDVTATVESIPLIAASVVSKKIAAGAKVIVLDIKYGRGAFMKTLEDAKALAHVCREIGKRLGRSISTVISSMEQPLGNAIGHSLEVKETIQTLKGKGPADLRELCLVLGSVALLDAGICKTLDEARMKLAKTLDDGSALAKFSELIASQGGDISAITNEDALPVAPGVVSIFSPQTGYVQSLDSLKIAMAAKLLGAGRDKKEDQIDLSVGVVLLKKVGDPVKQREAIAILYTGAKPSETAAVNALNAFVIGNTPPSVSALVDEVVF